MNELCLEGLALLPTAWRALPGACAARVFNPSIARLADGLALAYRVVLDDGVRRIAACRLDVDLRPVPGSQIALSDLIQGTDDWQADPRFLSHGNRTFIHFNNGHQYPNQIYLVEVAPDLRPLGPARPLALAGRRPVEKNWMLFPGPDGDCLAVYAIQPHGILRLSLEGTGPVHCTRLPEVAWDASAYTHNRGALRGGAPPVRVGDSWWSFFHSVHPPPFWARALRRLTGRDAEAWRRYAVGCYTFSAHPPFRPTAFTPRPLLLAPAPERGGRERLNPTADRVLYPAGAILEGDRWILSCGLQDAQAVLVALPRHAVEAALAPVAGTCP